METINKLICQIFVLIAIGGFLSSGAFSQQAEKTIVQEHRQQAYLADDKADQACDEASAIFDVDNIETSEEVDILINSASRALQAAINDWKQCINLEKTILEKIPEDGGQYDETEAVEILQEAKNNKATDEFNLIKLETSYKAIYELLHTVIEVRNTPRAEQYVLFMKAQVQVTDIQRAQERLIETIKTTREYAPQQYQDIWTEELKDAETQFKRLKKFLSYLSMFEGDPAF